MINFFRTERVALFEKQKTTSKTDGFKLNSALADTTSNQRGVILLTRTLLTFIVLISISYAMQSEIHYLPCDSTAKGYYYSSIGLTNHIPELESTMPLDIMIGYIVADSVSRNASIGEVWDYLYGLGHNDNDTLMYIIKYMYRMADYDPPRYRKFIETSASTLQHRIGGVRMENDVIRMLSVQQGDPRRDLLIASDYILHVTVNETVVTEIPEGIRCKSLIAGHSTVLEKIKGQILPQLGMHYGIEIGNNGSIVEQTYPNPTNFVFEYCPNWTRESGGMGEQFRKDGGIVCDDGSPWLKPHKEYIVFAARSGHCGCGRLAEENPSLNLNPNLGFEVMFALSGSLSAGMFPIEDGNVIDEGGYFGWGEVVPLADFKRNLQDLIDTIRNFGE